RPGHGGQLALEGSDLAEQLGTVVAEERVRLEHRQDGLPLLLADEGRAAVVGQALGPNRLAPLDRQLGRRLRHRTLPVGPSYPAADRAASERCWHVRPAVSGRRRLPSNRLADRWPETTHPTPASRYPPAPPPRPPRRSPRAHPAASPRPGASAA